MLYRRTGDDEYVPGNAREMPFPDVSFDSAFSNGSLRECEARREPFGMSITDAKAA